MNERPEIWLVVHGEELIAELAVEHVDWLWLRGSVIRREGFAALAPLFAREARLAAAMGDHTPGWWAAYRELRAQIRLIGPDGRQVPEFILHVDGGQARWRSIDPIPQGPLDEAASRFERPRASNHPTSGAVSQACGTSDVSTQPSRFPCGDAPVSAGRQRRLHPNGTSGREHSRSPR
jgi:hypothetical protein